MEPRAHRGVVLSTVATGDADLVVHLLGAGGRIDGYAPGAKKSRRRFAGALEPFNTVDLVFAARRRGDLVTLESAQVITSRFAITRDLGAVALASYAAELARGVAREGDAGAPLYALLEQILDRLAAGPPPAALRAAFELRLLDAIGLRPELEACVLCGRAPPAGWDLGRGGALCEAHRSGAPSFGPKTRAWAQAVLAASALDPEAGLDPDWAARAATKARLALDPAIFALLGRPPRSLALL